MNKAGDGFPALFMVEKERRFDMDKIIKAVVIGILTVIVTVLSQDDGN